MYLPNIIPSGIRTDWMHVASSERKQINQRHENLTTTSTTTTTTTTTPSANQTYNTNTRGRISDFPPLSFYTPVRSTPLFFNYTSKNSLSMFENSKRSSSNFKHDNRFEGMEQIGLEIGTRLQKLKENETWGYNWITPLGLDKTMLQILDDSNDDAEDIVDEEEEREARRGEEEDNYQRETGQEYNDVIDNGAFNNVGVLQDEDNNESTEVTDMMSENFGQMRRTSSNFEDTENENHDDHDRPIYGNESSTGEGYINERDLDEDLSDHDIDNTNYSDISVYQEENYRDDYDEEEIIEDGNGEEESDEDVGNDAIVGIQYDDDGDDYEYEYEAARIFHVVDTRTSILDNQSRSILHSSFHEDIESYTNPASHMVTSKMPTRGDDSGRLYSAEDERYFMALEDYQDDHSMLEGKSNKIYNSRGVSISETPFLRGSNYSVRRNANTGSTDSPNLTTPTTINSATANQITTGNTSTDNEFHEADFDMTLE